jgi:hypothetical protein
MPNGTGVVRPYTFLDVLMTINDQVNQVSQQTSGSVTGISVVGEADEASFTLADSAYGVAVTSPLVWDGTVWGSGIYG